MAGKKQNQRVGGYAVAIHGFIKVPADDINAQIERLKAVDAAIKSRDVSALVAMMAIDDVNQKFVNRMLPKEEPKPEPEPAQAAQAAQADAPLPLRGGKAKAA